MPKPKSTNEMRVLRETGVMVVEEPFLPNPVEAPKRPPLKYADLPLVSILPKPKFEHAISLLEELDQLKDTERAVKDRKDEILAELETLQRNAPGDVRGLRWGQLCFAVEDMPGRRTLKKEKLVMNGVDPRVIEASYETGKGFVQRNFKRLGEPDDRREEV